jgi:hypothetical protein
VTLAIARIFPCAELKGKALLVNSSAIAISLGVLELNRFVADGAGR